MRPEHVTIGQTWGEVQRLHQHHLSAWLQTPFQAGEMPEAVLDSLAA